MYFVLELLFNHNMNNPFTMFTAKSDYRKSWQWSCKDNITLWSFWQFRSRYYQHDKLVINVVKPVNMVFISRCKAVSRNKPSWHLYSTYSLWQDIYCQFFMNSNLVLSMLRGKGSMGKESIPAAPIFWFVHLPSATMFMPTYSVPVLKMSPRATHSHLCLLLWLPTIINEKQWTFSENIGSTWSMIRHQIPHTVLTFCIRPLTTSSGTSGKRCLSSEKSCTLLWVKGRCTSAIARQ